MNRGRDREHGPLLYSRRRVRREIKGVVSAHRFRVVSSTPSISVLYLSLFSLSLNGWYLLGHTEVEKVQGFGDRSKRGLV